MVDQRDPAFYRWRKMTDEQRAVTLANRQQHRLPWHSPPHCDGESGLYLIAAACFEHRPVVGYSSDRIYSFSGELVETCSGPEREVYSWVVLPNHYHILVRSPSAKETVASLGRLHGRTSYQWNGEEGCRGRQVWFNAMETAIKSERHFWSSLIYVMNNPVKHGYVERWQDWPYSNARDWLKSVGREEATRIWKEFPINDFGRDWDPPDL
jgi:putative transposase